MTLSLQKYLGGGAVTPDPVCTHDSSIAVEAAETCVSNGNGTHNVYLYCHDCGPTDELVEENLPCSVNDFGDHCEYCDGVYDPQKPTGTLTLSDDLILTVNISNPDNWHLIGTSILTPRETFDETLLETDFSSPIDLTNHLMSIDAQYWDSYPSGNYQVILTYADPAEIGDVIFESNIIDYQI